MVLEIILRVAADSAKSALDGTQFIRAGRGLILFLLIIRLLESCCS
jgi:hypothetical protein